MECGSCPDVFIGQDVSQVSDHILQSHPDVDPQNVSTEIEYSCLFCCQNFFDEAQMNDHVKNRHKLTILKTISNTQKLQSPASSKKRVFSETPTSKEPIRRISRSKSPVPRKVTRRSRSRSPPRRDSPRRRSRSPSIRSIYSRSPSRSRRSPRRSRSRNHSRSPRRHSRSPRRRSRSPRRYSKSPRRYIRSRSRSRRRG